MRSHVLRLGTALSVGLLFVFASQAANIPGRELSDSEMQRLHGADINKVCGEPSSTSCNSKNFSTSICGTAVGEGEQCWFCQIPGGQQKTCITQMGSNCTCIGSA